MFYGTFELTVDDKNRMLIPAEVRKEINPQRDGSGFFLLDGDNDVPWMYTETCFNKLATQYNTGMTPDANLMDYYRSFFGSACRLEWDKQFRVLIPARAKEQMKITGEVMMIGVNDHLELWNQEAWLVKHQDLKKNKATLVLKIQHAQEMAQMTQNHAGANA